MSSSSSQSVSGNEIITVCVGQCGISLGADFYSTIMNEHKINRDGTLKDKYDGELMDKHTTYFTSQKSKYIPRVIFCDLDCCPVDEMRSSYFGSLMACDNFLSTPKSMGSMTFAHGHYTDGAEFIQECMDKMRNSIEICDNMQGFTLMHGISGGVGGGFASLLLYKLRDNYPDKQLFSFSVFPSRSFYEERNTNIVTYNTLLSTHIFIENTDLCFIIDNGKLLSHLARDIKKNITMNDINSVLSLIMSGVTSTFRFRSEPNLNGSLKSMCSNFVCFPRLHFLSMSMSPIISNIQMSTNMNTNISKSLNELLFKNEITDIKFENGKILNLAIHYRSNAYQDNEATVDKMEQFITRQQTKLEQHFVKWIPHNVQSCFVYDGDNFCYEHHSPLISTAIHHTTSIKDVFQRITDNFKKVYRRKAYLHWYKGQGMDEMEFMEADKNVRDMIVEYQNKQDVQIVDETEQKED